MRQALEAGDAATIVDLACGRGRHALPLAERGRRVIAIDIAEQAVRAVREQARAGGAVVDTVVADARALPLRDGRADVVLCVSFLDRALFPHLHRLLRSGGRLIIETYTVDQRTLGAGPTSDAHLLARGELPTLVGPLTVIASREGLVRRRTGEAYLASVVAVNEGRGTRDEGRGTRNDG